MNNLLLDEQPLLILPKLASKLGLNESIILQQIHYWLKMKLNAKDGYYWVYNSYPQWVEQFPFWSETTVKRIITNLESKNLLITGNYNKLKIDKTKWYRINYEELQNYKENNYFDGKEVSVLESGQNDLTMNPISTNHDCNVNRPLPKITTKTTTDIKKTSSHSFSVDDMNNSKLLFELILDNNPNVKKPNLESWADDFRLMRTRDNRSDEQIKYLINWSQQDVFWKTNILSASKLRKQFDALIVKVKAEREKKSNVSFNNKPTTRSALDRLIEEEQANEEVGSGYAIQRDRQVLLEQN